MARITAQEARELCSESVQGQLDIAYERIRDAATEGSNQVSLYDWWATEAYNDSAKYICACKLLREDGFTVRFYYGDTGFQFALNVEMCTVVEW